MRIAPMLLFVAATLSSCCVPCMQSAPKIGDLEESSWTLIELANNPVEDSPVVLSFDAVSKTFSGQALCNNFFGSYHLYTPKKGAHRNIDFTHVGGTMRACPDMEVEGRFTRLLPSISRVKIEGEHLLMFNPGDSLMAVLVRGVIEKAE